MELQCPEDLVIFQKFGHTIIVTGDPRKILHALPKAQVVIGKPIQEYEFLDEVLARTPDQCHCYLLSHDPLHIETLRARGFDTVALVWDQKGMGSMSRLPGLRENSRVLLFGVKGQKALRKECSDILRFQPAAGDSAPPSALWHEIFQRSTLPGDEVLNPFGRFGLAPYTAATQRKVKLTAFDSWHTGEELCK